MEVSFDHLAKVVGARFSHNRPPLLLPSIPTLWKQVIECSHLEWGVKLQLLEGRSSYRDCLEFFYTGDLSLYPLTYSIIYLHQCGLTDIYFMFWVITQQLFILLLKLS